MLKKNQVYEVEIIDDGYQGEGIAKIENFPIFIPGAIKGEKVEIKILKVQTILSVNWDAYIMMREIKPKPNPCLVN